MTDDAPKPAAFIDAQVASHRIRLTFEQAATILAIVVLAIALAACLVSMWPAGWAAVIADHVNRIAGALLEFIGALGSLLGLSWGRGHMDARLERKDGDG